MNVLARTFPSTALLCPFFSPNYLVQWLVSCHAFFFFYCSTFIKKKKVHVFVVVLHNFYLDVPRWTNKAVRKRLSQIMCVKKGGKKPGFTSRFVWYSPSSHPFLLPPPCSSRSAQVALDLPSLSNFFCSSPPPSLSSFLDVASAILTTGLRFTRRRDDRNTAVRQPLWRSR